MKPEEIDAILRQTLHDRRLSRGERKALSEVLTDSGVTGDELAFWRHRAFAVARETLTRPDARQVLAWLEDVHKTLLPASTPAPIAEVFTSPGDDCLDRIRSLMAGAAHSIDIAVFTITDDRIARRILDAHRRGVRVRIVTDDDKALDRGSDAEALEAAGVPVRFDRSPHHMHHKFAVFDRRLLVNGSYNWTRSAANSNQENVIVTDDRRLVAAFQSEFEGLWESFGP